MCFLSFPKESFEMCDYITLTRGGLTVDLPRFIMFEGAITYHAPFCSATEIGPRKAGIGPQKCIQKLAANVGIILLKSMFYCIPDVHFLKLLLLQLVFSKNPNCLSPH